MSNETKQEKQAETVLDHNKPMNIFPTLGSLQDVVDLGVSRLPINNKNEVVSLLATYHNTLLKLKKAMNDNS